MNTNTTDTENDIFLSGSLGEAIHKEVKPYKIECMSCLNNLNNSIAEHRKESEGMLLVQADSAPMDSDHHYPIRDKSIQLVVTSPP